MQNLEPPTAVKVTPTKFNKRFSVRQIFQENQLKQESSPGNDGLTKEIKNPENMIISGIGAQN